MTAAERLRVSTECDGQVCLIAGTPELSPAERKELENKLKEREEFLIPIYHQVAVQFADLHDTPGRMQEKGVINVSTVAATSPDMSEPCERRACVSCTLAPKQKAVRGGLKQLVQIKPFSGFFGETFPFFVLSVIPKQFLIYMTLHSSEGKFHFTGGRLRLMTLIWEQLLWWSSGCRPGARVPAAVKSHSICVQVVGAILLQTSSSLSHHLESHRSSQNISGTRGAHISEALGCVQCSG